MAGEEQVSRFRLYVERTQKSQDALSDDIKTWKTALKDSVNHRSILAHIVQFEQFCKDVIEHLAATQEGRSEDEVYFKSQVVGALTSQWRIMRQIATQRLPDNPYQADLAELDQEAAKYYSIVISNLPEKTRQLVAKSTPIIYFGDAAVLTFFNDKKMQAPAIISTPFGVRSDEPNSRNRLSIAHETGHAIFNRLPDFLPQLKKHIEQNIESENPCITLFPIVIKWTDEIVADLVGVALAGADFGESSLSAMAMPKNAITYTDQTHPIPVIRPFISLFFFKYVKDYLHKQLRSQGTIIESQINELESILPPLEAKIKGFSDSYLDEPVNPLPTLAKFDIRAVKEAMEIVVNLILDSDLDGIKFGDILIHCYLNKGPAALGPTMFEPRANNWGENVVDKAKPFALDLSNFMPPEYAVPVAFPDLICKVAPFLPICSS